MAGENEEVPEVETNVDGDEAKALAAFNSGFEEVETPVESEKKADELAETPAEIVSKETADTPPTPAAAPEVKYRQLTEAEYAEWQAMRADWPKWVNAVQTANGNAGDAKQQVLSLQKALNGDGGEVELDSKDLEEDYPELAERLKKMLKPALKKRGAAPIDPDEVRKLANEIVDARERRALDEHYPGWERTVGAATSDNEFRRWLSTQPPIYRQQVLDSKSASYLKDVLDTFEKGKSVARSETPPTPPQPAATAAAATTRTPVPLPAPAQPVRGTIQRQRMRAAVQPSGLPASVPNVKSPHDHFQDGWNEG